MCVQHDQHLLIYQSLNVHVFHVSPRALCFGDVEDLQTFPGTVQHWGTGEAEGLAWSGSFFHGKRWVKPGENRANLGKNPAVFAGKKKDPFDQKKFRHLGMFCDGIQACAMRIKPQGGSNSVQHKSGRQPSPERTKKQGRCCWYEAPQTPWHRETHPSVS